MSIDFKALAKKQKAYVIEMRRDFHMHPELAGHEVRTSGRICEELDKMGLPYERVDELNVIAKLDTGRPGKTIAIRADIDALPVQELADVPFRSTVEGKMHACGHDAHAAILLGTAKAMTETKDAFSGIIYFCFQIGEETGIGAPECVAYLKAQGGVDKVFGLHVGASFDTGYIFLPEGPAMAGAFGWELTIHGKGGHGSQPHNAIDPIKPIMEILQRYTSLSTNRIDTFENFVVSPCVLQAGTARNIIPERAFASGTVRFYSKEVCREIMRLMREIADDIAHSYGATAELVIPGEPGIPVVNDPACAKIAQQMAAECGIKVLQKNPVMGSDNFGVFVDNFPGFYCFLGAGDRANGLCAPNHNPYFKLDESAFVLGVEFFLRCADAYLK